MAAWIQGGRGSFWWRGPQWSGVGWTMVLDEYGDLVLRTEKRVPAKRTLVEAGFLGVKVARGKGYAVGVGEQAWLVLLDGLVPAPKYSGGETSYHPGTEEIVVDFLFNYDELQARGLWRPAYTLIAREKQFFGTLNMAKRAVRRAFRLVGERPDRHPASTTGVIWISRKGETNG